MKKSLLALAVLGAFAGAASAQSSVTVYGIVDLGINSTDNGGTGAAGRTTAMTSGGQSASRIGFKGTEDLGNGLKANFVLEGGFSADTGASATNANQLNGLGGPAADASLFNRVSTVGLSGGFGAVNLGRQTTLLKDAHDQIDPFGAAGSTGNLERIFYAGLNPNGGRVSNTIKYNSPSLSGFKGSASYTFGETASDSGANRSYGLGLGYANGPLNVQFAYNDADISNSTLAGTLIGTAGTSGKVAFLGATYDFGVAKLHGAYADSKLEYPGAGGEDKARNYLVGVTVPFGAATLLASYAVNDDKSVGVTNADSQQFAIGLTYDLSKRTNLYTGYAHTSNDANAALGSANRAAYTGTGSPTSTPFGNSVSVFNVGIRHKF